MTASRGKSIARIMAGFAVCLLFPASAVIAGEPPATKVAIEGRAADFRRQDPGVPVWPSTCDCISVGFGFKDARGYRPVRFSLGDAGAYYSQDVAVMSESDKARLMAKGPLKILLTDKVPEESVQ